MKYITEEEYLLLMTNGRIPSLGENGEVTYTEMGDPELIKNIKPREHGKREPGEMGTYERTTRRT